MAEILTDREIDLAGDVCPFTFVKSKLVLEEMESGRVLSVKVDNAESASNVPRSMELEGHEILDVESVEGGWRIVVKKA